MESIQLDHVYIVDDDASVGDSLRTLLDSAGLSASAYTSAGEFFDRAVPLMPRSCMIIDIHMPQIGGLQLNEMLAAKGMKVPVIFISGRGNAALQVEAEQAGSVALLGKPLDEDGLVRALALAAARNQAR